MSPVRAFRHGCALVGVDGGTLTTKSLVPHLVQYIHARKFSVMWNPYPDKRCDVHDSSGTLKCLMHTVCAILGKATPLPVKSLSRVTPRKPESNMGVRESRASPTPLETTLISTARSLNGAKEIRHIHFPDSAISTLIAPAYHGDTPTCLQQNDLNRRAQQTAHAAIFCPMRWNDGS